MFLCFPLATGDVLRWSDRLRDFQTGSNAAESEVWRQDGDKFYSILILESSSQVLPPLTPQTRPWLSWMTNGGWQRLFITPG